ncbi:MAG: N-6 DNA methylase [Patescibacteria group bacterium]
MTINYNSTIKSLRDIVWGVVTDPLSQIEQITLLIFIKLLSERHNELERLKAKKLIFTGEYASYHFDSLSRLSGYELVDTTRKAVESLYKNPNIDEPIRRLYERSYLQVNDPRVLSLLINEINKIDIAHIDMGDFYEHLLAALGTQKEAGQFRTPRHLIEFIVDIINPQIGERVLDPACGTAGFLTAAYTHIRDVNTSQEARKTDSYLDKLNFDQKTFLLNKTIFGFDIDPKMIKFAISNLYLHNIKNPNISQHNTLTSNDSWEEKYEVILTNPPFSTPKGGVKPTDRFTLDSKRTEVLFAEYVIEHLTLNGRAGVIVPEGIIFQSGKAYKELRKWLVEDNYLYAVVSLPSGVFNPYSNVKTNILFIDRERVEKLDKILFCKVDNDGFDLGAQRRPIDKNDLPEVLKVVKEYKADPNKPINSKLAYSVAKENIIKSGDYNLIGERYNETISITSQKWPMVELSELENKKGVEFLRGSGLSKKSLDSNGKNKCILYGELYTLYQPIIKNVTSKTNEKGKVFSEVGDLLIPGTTTADAMGIAIARSLNEKGVILAGDINIIRTNNKIVTSDFLSLLINYSLKERLAKFAKGTNIIHLSNKDIKKIKIPLLPLSVQQQIVDELDSYQKVIDGVKQIIDNYTPLIKIDANWNTVEIDSICKLVRGSSPRPQGDSRYYGGKVPRLLISDVTRDGMYVTPETDFLTEEGAKLSRPMKKSEVVMAVSGNSGLPAILKVDACIHDGFVGFRELSKKVLPEFLYYIFLYQKAVNNSQSIGAVFKNLTTDQIKKFKIPLPSVDVQRQVIANLQEEQKLVEANKKLIQLFGQKIKDKIEEVWGEKK